MADIRFLRLANGASIAYTTIGQGPPLVFPPAAVTHLAATLAHPAYLALLERLGESFSVIIYDRWGSGLSDRKRGDWSLEADISVLGEVVDHLQLEPLTLVGISGGGPASVLYASRHPGRVSHLVLYGT